jgi:serine/threonine protein phosphatase PrpC
MLLKRMNKDEIPKICEQLLDKGLAKDYQDQLGTDNMTCVLIEFIK